MLSYLLENREVSGTMAVDYFDGKFWIYPTTDGFSGWSGNYFHAFSSTDLVNWTDEGVILDVNKDHQPTTDGDENTAISPWSVGSAWAPTIEKKNGKYYFYYCAKLPNGTSAIGVAVADNPAGPFKAADQPLVTRTMEGVTVGQASRTSCTATVRPPSPNSTTTW